MYFVQHCLQAGECLLMPICREYKRSSQVSGRSNTTPSADYFSSTSPYTPYRQGICVSLATSLRINLPYSLHICNIHFAIGNTSVAKELGLLSGPHARSMSIQPLTDLKSITRLVITCLRQNLGPSGQLQGSLLCMVRPAHLST